MASVHRVRCSAAPPLCVPDAPALTVGVRTSIWLTPAGEVLTLSRNDVVGRLEGGEVPILCHAPAAARRLAMPPFPAYDLLELFAFVRPARFCLPTARGLAQALLLTPPETPEQEAAGLLAAAGSLLAELRASPRDDALAVAWTMAKANWSWGPAVIGALAGGDAPADRDLAAGLRVWHRLREWTEPPPPGKPDSWPVESVEARARLVKLVGQDAEARPQQMVFASHVSAAFKPRDTAGAPAVVVAEAGTGVGKTLGYIAPASVWSEKNKGSVWISTYTRNLQRQLDRELDRLYPDLREKRRHVVVRKGRENMFCLLNFDEAVARLPARGGDGAGVALGLVARWVSATRDGDMVGGDFPGWLADLLGAGLTVDLTDTRGECIYGACRHYRKCFVERTIRRARQARIVVANHALVMVQAALGGGDDQVLPTRFVFDEGHHLFEAADSAFSAHLTGRETADLRRWLLGAEERRRSRSRGLKARLGDLVTEDQAARSAMETAIAAARVLPGPGWRRRLTADMPMGLAEMFFDLVRRQVHARDNGNFSNYSLECALHPAGAGLAEAGAALGAGLERLIKPLTALRRQLAQRLDTDAADLDTATRQRIEAMMRSLERRAILPVAAWRSMLRGLEAETPAAFVDWLGIERVDGNEIDVGLHRHWRDPMEPFIHAVSELAHGLVITSATLLDRTGDGEADWSEAEARLGLRHLAMPPVLSAVESPFDYAACTRLLVVTDVNRESPDQVAAALRELFLAAGGGGLGLFTAVQRLRAAYARIAPALEAAGIRVLAQHVDALDTGTLVDIFRAEENACLLGTDAVRDGVDVPGRSLRLIVFDRVPWPRPDLLHRARRAAFGGRRYDELLTRLRLKQAYGRLIRRADDRGVFVMLDRALPSRLLAALPAGVAVERVGLADAVRATRAFLAPSP
ncbi:MAG: ATP-dependent DNA helicase [Rhodospirillales bacterium]|nr:MAG: ATP-dependent DNA helicase [Rhodospirillales bacterium]